MEAELCKIAVLAKSNKGMHNGGFGSFVQQQNEILTIMT